MLEIVVNWSLDAAQLAAEIDGVRAVLQIADARVLVVGGAEHGLRLGLEVRTIDARDLHRRGQHAFAVAQRDPSPSELLGECLGHVERDRHRPEHAAREPHVASTRSIVVLAEETLERRERAVQQHLDVAELAHVEIPRRQVARGVFLGSRRLR